MGGRLAVAFLLLYWLEGNQANAALAFGFFDPANYQPVPSGPLTILSQPMMAANFQRSTFSGGLANRGTGTIPLGIMLSAPAVVNWRIRDAVTSGNPVLESGTFTGTQPAGQSTVMVPVSARLGWVYADVQIAGGLWVLGSHQFGMGDNTAIAGQSLAVNMLSRTIADTSTTTSSLGLSPNPNTSVLGTWGVAPGTSYFNNPPAWSTPGDHGPYGSSFAVEYLNRMVAATGVNQGLIGHAMGASSMAQWAPGGAYEAQLKSVLSAAGPFRFFFWRQGHADSILATGSSTWQNGLTAIKADLTNTYGGFTTLVSTIGSLTSTTQGSPQAINTIRAAGKAWATSNGGVYLDLLDGALADGIHTTQAGKILEADHTYRAAVKILNGSGPGDVGPTISTAIFTSPTTIKITIAQNAGTALVDPGTLSSQLELFTTGTTSNALNISSANIVGANEVDVTLSAAPNSAVDIYARYPIDLPTAAASGVYDNAVDGDGLVQGRMLTMNTSPVLASNSFVVAQTDLTMASPTYDTATPKFGTAALSGGYGSISAVIPSPPYTIDTWIKSGVVAGPLVAFGRYGSLWVGTNSPNGKLAAVITNASGTATALYASAVNIQDGNWHHVAVQVSATGTAVYADGTLQVSSSQVPTTSNAAFGVRNWGVGGSYGWNGEIDQPTIWSGLRYSGSTYSVPTTAYTGTENGLIVTWPLDGNGTGTK